MLNKKFILFLSFILILSACHSNDKNKQTKTEVIKNPTKSKIEIPEKNMKTVILDAPSLVNNLLGEKSSREIGIYLPENYEKETKLYPVVYFLVGYNNSIEDFDNWADLENIITCVRLDKNIKDIITVVVDDHTNAGGSFYVNSPVFGNWEDFITKDLVSYIDNNYRTIKNSKSRGLSGHSMGGFGAINIGMKYSEIFGYVYSMNPGLFNEDGLEKAIFFNEDETQLKEQCKIADKFLIDDEKLINIRFKRLLNSVTMLQSYGMAFSYTDKIPYYELPFKIVDDKIIKDDIIFNKWKQGFGNMKEKVILNKDNLKKLEGFVVDYGLNDDYPWIPKGCIYLEEILKEEEIPHEMRPNSGDHGNLIKERMTKYMFPYFSENLEF